MLFLLAAAAACARPQPKEAGVPDLEAMELRRAPSSEVRALLSSADFAVRARAALAAGRIADAQAAPRLAQLLDDEATAGIAAWALGRIDGGADALAACLRRGCRSASDAARALAGPAAARRPRTDALVEALPGAAGDAAAFALGVLARSKDVKFPAGTHAVLSRMLPRAGAAYALSRLPPGAVDADLLQRTMLEAEPWTRALAARAWGKQGLPASGLGAAFDDPDWRVRVEAARGLPSSYGPAKTLRAALSRQRNEHVLVALHEAAGQIGELVDLPRQASLPVRCTAAAARDRVRKSLIDTPGCGAGQEPQWRSRARAGVLAADLGLVVAARAALHDADGRVRAAAAAAAGPPLYGDLRALLSDPDPYVVQSAAATLVKDAAASRHAARAAALRLAPAHGRAAGDSRSDALAALAALTGPMPQLLPTPNAALAAALGAPVAGPLPVPVEARASPDARRLRLRTARGEMVIELRPDLAPLASSALATLARRNFYDGLTFHRVVADFVVQGGDPRGDGDGGPGWALPDEHTPARFVRGTLGIATSGPETGGSQFFLCHSPQPHLDGRYTIAGQLQAGEEVMDALQPGDGIVSARAE